jgi:outer membrane protein TolC
MKQLPKFKLSTHSLLGNVYPLVVFFIFFISLNSGLSAQITSQAKPAENPKLNGVDTSGLTIEQKLVALALSGPAKKSLVNQSKINEYQLRAAKNTWVNLLTLSANFNEQNAFTQNQAATFVFPRYFFGVNIPLGTLLSRTSVKAAKEQLSITKNNIEQLDRDVKADILSKYKEYQTYGELITVQSQTLDDEEAAYLQAKEKFRNGVILIEEYNIVQKKYNGELAAKLNLQMQRDLKKIEIERIIGTSLESVLNIR